MITKRADSSIVRDSSGRVVLTVEKESDSYFASYGNMPYFSAYKYPLKSSNIDDATTEAVELCRSDYEKLLENFKNKIYETNIAIDALGGTSEMIFPRENEFMAVC